MDRSPVLTIQEAGSRNPRIVTLLSVQEQMLEAYQTVGEHLQAKFNWAKHGYDKKVQEVRFGLYSDVWFFCPVWKPDEFGKFRKLTDGPYRIARVLNDVNYVIQKVPGVDCRFVMWADCWDMKINRPQSGYVTTTPNVTSTPRPSCRVPVRSDISIWNFHLFPSDWPFTIHIRPKCLLQSTEPRFMVNTRPTICVSLDTQKQSGTIEMKTVKLDTSHVHSCAMIYIASPHMERTQ